MYGSSCVPTPCPYIVIEQQKVVKEYVFENLNLSDGPVEEYNEYVETKAYEEKLLTETVDSESEKAEIVCEVEEKRKESLSFLKKALDIE